MSKLIKLLSPARAPLHRFVTQCSSRFASTTVHNVVDIKAFPVFLMKATCESKTIPTLQKVDANKYSPLLFRSGSNGLCIDLSHEFLPREVQSNMPVNLDDILTPTPIEENGEPSPMELHKRDKYWRKRRMRRHRLLRWRKQSHHYPALLSRRLEKRKRKHKEDLEKTWKAYGLDKEPPPLAEEEKKRFVREWQENGIWTDVLSEEELKSFAKITNIRKKTDKN